MTHSSGKTTMSLSGTDSSTRTISSALAEGLATAVRGETHVIRTNPKWFICNPSMVYAKSIGPESSRCPTAIS